MEVLQEHGLCEKMSVDEVFLDVTTAVRQRRRRRCEETLARKHATSRTAPKQSPDAWENSATAAGALTSPADCSSPSAQPAHPNGSPVPGTHATPSLPRGHAAAKLRCAGESVPPSEFDAHADDTSIGCPGCDGDCRLLSELHALQPHLPPDEYVFTAKGDSSPATCGWFSSKPRAPADLTAMQEAELNRRESRDAAAATHVVGYDGGRLAEGFVPQSAAEWDLLEGALLAAEVRRDVYWRTGYAMSAGVSYNKLLSKIGSGMHKPGQQTLILQQQ
jgi:nucleotidyltransferase/DNA polymerase involved in DNA repair